MTQLNTPYPATAYPTGCLQKHAPTVEVTQADFSIELFLRLFSRRGLQLVLDELSARARSLRSRGQRLDMPASIANFLGHGSSYVHLIEPVLRFLQGHDPSLALRIAGRGLLPEGPRFASLSQASVHRDGDDPLGWAFGKLGTTDRARHLASLFIDDLADVLRDGIDPRFELSRYGEKLAASAHTFCAMADALDDEPTLVDTLLDELTRDWLTTHQPDVVGITATSQRARSGSGRGTRSARRDRPASRSGGRSPRPAIGAGPRSARSRRRR